MSGPAMNHQPFRSLVATTGKMPVGPTARMDCATSRPGDEAELVVLLQMGMSGQDPDTETVGAGFACRN